MLAGSGIQKQTGSEKQSKKLLSPPWPKATKEQLEYAIQTWGDISEYKLLKNFSTQPLIVEDYLNKSSPP
jgi:hypothetical protein